MSRGTKKAGYERAKKQTFGWLDKLILPPQKSVGLILAWYIP